LDALPGPLLQSALWRTQNHRIILIPGDGIGTAGPRFWRPPGSCRSAAPTARRRRSRSAPIPTAVTLRRLPPRDGGKPSPPLRVGSLAPLLHATDTPAW